MDSNNWRPAAAQGAEPSLETEGDWRTQLSPDSRHRIVNKIMETLQKQLPFSGQDGLEELKKIAVRFEEKIYTAAVSQPDYLRKISLKMLTMEAKSQNNIMPNSLPSNSFVSNRHSDPANLSQARQQMLSQNIPNDTGVQSSASLTSSLLPVSSLSQNSISNAVVQNNSGIPQGLAGSSIGQGVPPNMFANSQRQMPGRQQVVPQQQQQQPLQNTQQYPYQQQLLKQQLHQQGNIQQTLVQSHMQQQQQQPQQQEHQQQNILQPTSQQSSMQTSSVMQPSIIQSANLSGLQQNQPSSTQQSAQSMVQHPQSILRQQQQAASIHQQQAPMIQQSLLPSQQQQQQQLMAQQPNAANMQQNQLIARQNNVGDMQQQQQQRLLGQQNNLQNLQQQQQQQLLAQQNNLSNMHQQQLGSQGNVTGLQQQQQLVGTQPGNSTMQSNQHSLHMLQHQKVPLQHQTQQNATNMMPNQGQQSQQQLLSQMQSQPTQLQQQLGLQQQPNQIQRDMQPGLQAATQVPGSLLQQQNAIDQQKHLYQSQRPIPETSSTSLDSTAPTGHSGEDDLQEEVHQKIKSMKEMYLPELNEMYQKIASKLQLLDSLSQQPKPDQLEKLKVFKTMLERLITLLQFPHKIIGQPDFKQKLSYYEKQIIQFLNSNKGRKPISPLQQGQLGQPIQQPHSQVSQVQSHENQMNPQIQPINMQGSVPNMQQNNMTGMKHTSLSSLSGVSTSQQNLMNSLQPTSSLDSSQGNALGSLQQTAVGPLQQNTVSAPQQANVTNFPSQSGVNILKPTIPLQSNPNMLQHQHLKQQQEQMLHSQQLKQRQLQQQSMKQQILQHQQLHQQAKQQLPAQMQAHQMSQVHQMNDVNELKMRQGMGVKPGVFQQHISVGQRTHQQMKSGASFPISSPQLLQAASPQLSQHSSPQVDQQNLLSSLTKSGTPLQSANSPFIVPSPPTSLAPSPMPGDSEKPVSGLSSLSNVAGNVGQQQASVTQVPAPSLAIGTPGISASPLLDEFIVSDVASGKSSVTEQPIERLIRAVESISSQSLKAAVSDIGHVVGMIDRIAGSAPGNGSRAAVGEDLVAMTNCRLQARNFITQDGMSVTRKMKRYISAMPLNVASSAGSVSDSYKFGPDVSDLESTATSSLKRPRIEANHALLEEIREINLRLIDTVVDICEEDADPTAAAAAAAAEGGEGTIVKCSYIAVALSPNLKSQYTSAQMSPIQPLRLLVPKNYPSCSPVLLDKLPVEISENEDLSIKAKSRFGICLRTLSQPMSLGEMARTWDVCARAVITEYAQQSGGGTFSSKYGTWENCMSAA